jgi:hypothetical protein
MKRSELEHLIPAAGSIANDREIKETLISRLGDTAVSDASRMQISAAIQRDFPSQS